MPNAFSIALNKAKLTWKHRKALFKAYKFYLLQMEFHDWEWGSVKVEEEKGLARAVELSNASSGPLVEIGCLFGLTTNLIASLKPPEKKFYAVENFSWNPFQIPTHKHRVFTKRVMRLGIQFHNVELYDGDSGDFYKSYEGEPPSMIFIDADHSYEAVKNDIAQAKTTNPLVIAGHDYDQFNKGVIRAVNEAFGEENVETYGSVWVVKNGQHA